MKTKISVLFLLALALFSCNKEKDDTIQIPYFIYETSFETDGTFDASGWTGAGFSASDDTPSEEDNFSLKIEPQWFPQAGLAEYTLTGISGEVFLDLQFYTKSIDWVGEVQVLHVMSNGETENILTEQLEEEEWTFKSFILELDIASEDSLMIKFIAGGTEVATGQVLIDQVKVMHLNP